MSASAQHTSLESSPNFKTFTLPTPHLNGSDTNNNTNANNARCQPLMMGDTTLISNNNNTTEDNFRSVSPTAAPRSRSLANSPSKHPRSPSLSRRESFASTLSYALVPPMMNVSSIHHAAAWRKDVDAMGSCNTSMASMGADFGFISTSGGSVSARSVGGWPVPPSPSISHALRAEAVRSPSPGIAYTAEEKAMLLEQSRLGNHPGTTYNYPDDMMSMSYRSDSPSRYSSASFSNVFGSCRGGDAPTPLPWRRTSMAGSSTCGSESLEFYRPASPSAAESAATMLARAAMRQQMDHTGASVFSDDDYDDDDDDQAKRYRIERARSVMRDHPSEPSEADVAATNNNNCIAHALSAHSPPPPFLSTLNDASALTRECSPAPPVYRQRTVSPSVPRDHSPVAGEGSPLLAAQPLPIPLRQRSVRFHEPTTEDLNGTSSSTNMPQQRALSASQPRPSEGRTSELSVYSAADDEPQVDTLQYLRADIEAETADGAVASELEWQAQRRRMVSRSQHAIDMAACGDDVDDVWGDGRGASPPMRERSMAPAEVRGGAAALRRQHSEQ